MNQAQQNDRHQLPGYTLRMPESVRETLAAEALRNRRSLHSEILMRLEASLPVKKIGVPLDEVTQ